MSQIVKNNCGVLTILPLGIECNVVNSSNPFTADGAIYLNITGGSAPYSITWDNGKKSQNIYNLLPGDYGATVVDNFGDYTGSTVCTVESNKFFVDYFEQCFTNDFLYLTGLTTTVIQGSVYKFTNIEGCWEYSGKILWDNETLTGDTIFSGPFETCDECDPPIPVEPFPEQICLFSTSNTFVALPFEFYGFENGKPAYTGTGIDNQEQSIIWSTGSTINQWIVEGRSGLLLANTNDTFTPVGAWTLFGIQQTYQCTSGSCPSAPQLSFTFTPNDETCQGTCDGSLTVNSVGGTPPYAYSINGTTFQGIPVFNNLCPQSGTLYVRDSTNTIVTKDFTIGVGPRKTTYRLSLDVKKVDTELNYGTKVSFNYEYVVNVTPELPVGVEITVPLVLSATERTTQPGQTTVTFTPTLFSGNTAITTSPTLNSSTVINQTPFNNIYYPYPRQQKIYGLNYSPVTLKRGLTISGKVESSIIKVSSGSQVGCTSRRIENLANDRRFYRWINCTGGTENNYILGAGESVEICARQVTLGGTLGESLQPGSGIVVSDGTLQCGNAVTDGELQLSIGINGPSINDSCSLLQLVTTNNQKQGQLYQNNIYGFGNSN
jgi:hypothetical protein